MATHEAGAQVTCPGCGRLVMQHSMIPLVGDGGQGIAYLCPPCARRLVHPAIPEEAPADSVTEPGEARPPAEPAETSPAD